MIILNLKKRLRANAISYLKTVRTLLKIALFFAMVATAQAQTTFTQHVKSQKAGEGKVVIIQDSLIDAIVNNIRRAEKKTTTTGRDKKDTVGADHKLTEGADETASHTRVRYKASGYRIQIFTGSNSHNDKQQAHDIGEKCQKLFPTLSAYPRFISPRWICRVGDFATIEEAQEYLQKIREARISKESRIVKCEVLLLK